MSDNIAEMKKSLQEMKNAKKPGDTSNDAAIASLEKAIAAAEREASSARSSGSDGSGIWNFIKDNWFLGLITLGAFWFFGSHPEGQKLWEGIKEFLAKAIDTVISWLPEDWQEGARKFVAGFKATLGGDASDYVNNLPYDDFIKDFGKATGLEETALKQHIPNDTAKKALVGFLKQANGGGFTEKDLAGPNTIYALMTSEKYAPLFMDIAKASLAKAGDGKKLEGKSLEIVKSLREIVASDKLDALVTTHAATTTKLLKALRPQEEAELIDLMMQHGSAEGGKATDSFRTLLTKMLPDAEGKMPDKAAVDAAIAEYKKLNPKLLAKGAEEKFKTPEGRAFKEHNEGKAYQAASAAAGGEGQLITLLDAYMDKKNSLQTKMKIALQNRDVFEAYYKASDPRSLLPAFKEPLEFLVSIPKDATAPLIRMFDKGDPTPLLGLVDMKKGFKGSEITKLILEKPELGDYILALGAKDVVTVAKAYAVQQKIELPDIFNENTLESSIRALQAIAKNIPKPEPAPKPQAGETLEKKAAREREASKLKEKQASAATKLHDTKTFLEGLTEALVKDNPNAELTKNLTPDALARFMRDDKNKDAFWAMLGGLQAGGLPKKKEEMVLAMLRRKDALTDVARDAGNGAPLIIEYLKTLGKGDACTKDSCMPKVGLFDTFSLTGGLNSLGRNREALTLFAQEVHEIQCGKLTPSPTPDVPSAPAMIAP